MIMTGVESLQEMLEYAERKHGPNALSTRALREQLRAAQEAQPTAYLQFILGSHQLGPEKEE
jgi:hypothetical protein